MLPASWEGYTGKVVFRRHFRLEESSRGKSVRLVVMGLSRKCAVSLNGSLIAQAIGPSTEIRLPEKLTKFGERNTLEIEVDNRLHPLKSLPLRNGTLTTANYGGITDDIFLILESLPAITNLSVFTDIAPDLKSAEAAAVIKIDRPHVQEISGETRCRLLDSSGNIIAETSTAIGLADTLTLKLKIQNPNLWSPQSPYLYRIEAALKVNGETLPLHSRTCGFRSFTADDAFRLNGGKIKLKGMSYRAEGDYGYTFKAEDYLRDLRLIQFAGAQAILLRRPAHPYFLALCDSAGLLLLQSTGLEGAPAVVVEREDFTALAGAHVKKMVYRESHHPAVIAWILGTALESGFPWRLLANYIPELDTRVTLMGLAGKPAKLIPVTTADSVSGGLIAPIDLGPLMLNDSEEIQPLQSAALSRILQEWKEADALFLRALADWNAGRTILFQNTTEGEGIFHSGLVSRSRQQRMAYRRLREGWFNIPTLTAEVKEAEPLVYPILGFALLTVIVLYLRGNKVFRHHLRRYFIHPHGFFQDIRNRRFIQSSETLFVGVFSALALAIIISAALYRIRLNPAADYLLAHLCQGTALHSALKILCWRPIESIAVLSLALILFYLFASILIRIISAFFRRRVTFVQCLIVVFWVNSLFLWLTPVTVFFYRGLDIYYVRSLEIMLVGLFILMVFFRAVNGCRVACGSGYIKVLTVFLLTHIVLIAALFLYFQHHSAISYYWDYIFSAVI